MAKNQGQLQLAFNETVEKKNRLTVLKMDFKHKLEDIPEYTKWKEKQTEAQKQAKIIKLNLELAENKLMEEIDKAKVDLQGHKEKLSSVAIKFYTEGKKVEVTDDDGNTYDPEFKVSFKKRKE